MVPPDSHGISRVPCYLGYTPESLRFVYGAITLCAGPFHGLRLRRFLLLQIRQIECPTTPTRNAWRFTHRFGLFRFRSPLLTESRLFSLPVGTEMFHFPTFPPLPYVFRQGDWA